MDFNQIQKLAIKVKDKYRKLEIARMGREWNVSELTEGFVGDAGSLMKLVMAKEGKRIIENVDERLKEEISDCLWAIICIADKLNINIEKSFSEKMYILEKRIDRALSSPTQAD